MFHIGSIHSAQFQVKFNSIKWNFQSIFLLFVCAASSRRAHGNRRIGFQQHQSRSIRSETEMDSLRAQLRWKWNDKTSRYDRRQNSASNISSVIGIIKTEQTRKVENKKKTHRNINNSNNKRGTKKKLQTKQKSNNKKKQEIQKETRRKKQLFPVR